MIIDLKPYPEYIDSCLPWLGPVPAHWQIRPGLAVFREKQEKNIGLIEKRVLSLSYGRIVVKPEEKLHGLVPESFETYQIVNPGDIIIRSTDLQNDWNSLRVGLVRDRGIITSAYICLKITGPMHAEFAYQQLHAFDLMKVFYGMGSGLRQNLEFHDFKRMPALVPPEDEQDAIVYFIDHVSARIEQAIHAKKKLIELLNEQRAAVIERTVTRGLETNPCLRPSGHILIGSIPDQWQVLQLRRLVAFVTSGSRGWAEYYSDDGDIFLQSGNLGRSMALKLSPIQRVKPPEGSEGERTRVRRNDILICITGALTGNVAIVDRDFAERVFVNQHIALVRPRAERANPKFLAYALHSTIGKKQFKTTEYGGTKQALGLNDVKDVYVPLPPMAEQHAICAKLDSELAVFGESIARIYREIDLLREYRTRVVADVVTGKLDTREAARKLPPRSEKKEETIQDEIGELEVELGM